MKVAVAGGTGLTGAHVVRELIARGHEPVVLARATGVDLQNSDGLEARLAGVDALIDTTNLTTTSARASVAFFSAVTANLLAAGRHAGVPHHVTLSIVGIDRVETGYYRGKLAQERRVSAAGGRHTILRATQFHEFAGQVLARTQVGPVAFAPRMRVQPIAAREVAAHLVDTALRTPSGQMIELAGPRVEEMTELARSLLQAGHPHSRLIAFRLPGAGGRAMAGGGLLPTDDGPRGVTTFAQWLAGEDARPWR